MKLKKLVAFITAGALCLGMSLTAFAADSSREIVPGNDGYSTDGMYEADQTEYSQEELQEIADLATDWLQKYYPNIAKDAQVITAGDYTLYDWTTGKRVEVEKDQYGNAKVPGGKTMFTFDVPSYANREGFKDGATVYALHQRWTGETDANGNKLYTFDIINGKLRYDQANHKWVIEAEMDGFSPITFIKVMSDGTIVEVDWKNDVVNPAKAASPKASPKTGE